MLSASFATILFLLVSLLVLPDWLEQCLELRRGLQFQRWWGRMMSQMDLGRWWWWFNQMSIISMAIDRIVQIVRFMISPVVGMPNEDNCLDRLVDFSRPKIVWGAHIWVEHRLLWCECDESFVWYHLVSRLCSIYWIYADYEKEKWWDSIYELYVFYCAEMAQWRASRYKLMTQTNSYLKIITAGIWQVRSLG